MVVGEEHALLESRAGIGRSSDAKRRHRRLSRASRSRAVSSTVLVTPRFRGEGGSRHGEEKEGQEEGEEGEEEDEAQVTSLAPRSGDRTARRSRRPRGARSRRTAARRAFGSGKTSRPRRETRGCAIALPGASPPSPREPRGNAAVTGMS